MIIIGQFVFDFTVRIFCIFHKYNDINKLHRSSYYIDLQFEKSFIIIQFLSQDNTKPILRKENRVNILNMDFRLSK